MNFEQVYDILKSYRTAQGKKVLFLLAEETMKSIYECVLTTRAFDCVELGTGYGATTCVIAAALEELGRGQVTTVDLIERNPIGVRVLAEHTGLSRHINAVVTNAGYNWFLANIIATQSDGTACKPCFDFCFLDGAHEWGPDALATFLIAKLLRPGAWFVLDDINFKLRGCQPDWEKHFGDRSDQELDAYQVGMVFDLVARQHPDFAEFTLSDIGRTGWARKVAENHASWQPLGLMLELDQRISWTRFPAIVLAGGSTLSEGVVIKKEGEVIAIEATQADPKVFLPSRFYERRQVNVLTFRLRLIVPANGVLQVFWVTEKGENFSEKQSVRVGFTATNDFQDVSIRITEGNKPKVLYGLRLDFTEGSSLILLESFAIGS
jgi:predicted O-methyltransferase YrrM